MLWDITGANRETGEDATIQIEADTRDSAIRRAGRAGVLVSEAVPAVIDFDEVSTEPFNISGSAATFPPPFPTSFASPPSPFGAGNSNTLSPPAFLAYASHVGDRPIGAAPSGLGIASLAMGCVAILVIVILCLNILSIPLAILGLVFGIISWVGAAKHKTSGLGLPIAGTAVSGFAMLLLLALGVFVLSIFRSMPTAPVPLHVTRVTPNGGSVSSFTAYSNQQQAIKAAQQQANLAMQQSVNAQRQAVAQQQIMQQMQRQHQQQFQPVQPLQSFQPPQSPRMPGRPF